MSLTDLERIAEEMDASQRVPPVPFEQGRDAWVGIQLWANQIRAWIANEREFIEASDALVNAWTHTGIRGKSQLRCQRLDELIAAYRAREERNAE